MDYFQYIFEGHSVPDEVLIAFLSELPFDTFEEKDGQVHAYVPAGEEALTDAGLLLLQEQFSFVFEKKFIAGQNWNELWESNFHPVIVDDFCGIRAGFHAPLTGVQYELVIQPRMAFGTGHHETTRMMIEWMRDLDFAGKQVFDYGCGTGILAILAEKLGAADIAALDIEAESWRNTLENATVNGCSHIRAFQGELKDMPADHYDGIMANINRNVILQQLPALFQMMQPEGWLLVSGFTKADETMMRLALAAAGYVQVDKKENGQWLSLLCRAVTV